VEFTILELFKKTWIQIWGYVSVNNCSAVNFLCYKSEPYEESILYFDFEKERINWVQPLVGEEVPIETSVLRGLNDRVCRSYYFENTRTIYHCIFENDYTWEHLLQVNTP
jgi:hypothetical protein